MGGNDDPLGYALGAGGADVVLVDDIQHGAAGGPGDHADGVGAQGGDRQHGPDPALGAAVGQPPELHRENDLQNQRQEEGGGRDRQHGQHHDEAVDPLIMVCRGDHPE